MAKLRTLLFFLTVASFFGTSCNQSPNQKRVLDSMHRVRVLRDSLKSDSTKAAAKLIMDIENGTVLKDTIGLSTTPVKVISSSLIKREYGNYNDIKLVYKNVSKKDITGIKFRWKGIDIFGDPADMGGHSAPGEGGGFTDVPLKAGKKTSGTWDILSERGKTVTMAWPIEVVFADGSKWKL